MAKRYLIPMDFTEVSIHSLRYAHDLTTSGDILDIIHIDSTAVTLTASPVIQNFEERANELQYRLCEYIDANLGEGVSSTCNVKVLTGEIVNTITQEAATTAYEAIIMGIRDKYNLFDKLIGHVALGVVKQSPVSVMLIPFHVSFAHYKKVLIASDHSMTNLDSLDKLKSWNADHNAILHLVHISNPQSSQKAYSESKINIVESFFESEEVNFIYQIYHIQGDDIATALLKEAKEKSVDIIISFPNDQDFITSLFVSSVTKELILKSVYPLYFLK